MSDNSPFPTPSVSWGYPLDRDEKEVVEKALREADAQQETDNGAQQGQQRAPREVGDSDDPA